MRQPRVVLFAAVALGAGAAPAPPRLELLVTGAVSNPRAPVARRSLYLAGNEAARASRGHLLSLPIGAGSAAPALHLDLEARRWDAAAAVEAAGRGPLEPGASGRTADGQRFWPGRHVIPASRTAPPALGELASAPVLVDPPAHLTYLHLDVLGYRSFAFRHRGRRPILVVPAGDGFLHGFDELSGAEVFAFAPKAARAGLSGGVGYDDVRVGAEWRTLISGTSAPAAGVYALDVTQPDSAEGAPRGNAPDCLRGEVRGCRGPYPRVLWELVDGQDADANGRPDMAPSAAAPAFARVPLAEGGGVGDRSVVIFGGGLSPDDLVPGRGALNRSGTWLYVADAGTGKLLAKLGEGVQLDGARRRFGAIPGAVTVLDLDGDARSDTAFFGDASGQLWKLSMPASEPAALGPDGRLRPPRPGVPRSPWVPLLVFDGPHAEGTAPCGGRLPGEPLSACGEERLVMTAPSVVGLGRNPKTGEDILGIAWVEGAGGRARVRFLVEGAATPTGARFRIAGPQAPRAGACGGDGPARMEGWDLELSPGDEAVARPLAAAGYLFLATFAPRASAANLYRLFVLNGDPCRGADCCDDSAPWARDRKLPLQSLHGQPGAPRALPPPTPPGRAASVTPPFVYVDPSGEPGIGVVVSLAAPSGTLLKVVRPGRGSAR